MQADSGHSSSARVLLVGEDPRSAATIIEMLRAAWPSGLLVTQVAHVADAVQELGDHTDSCVLLELPAGAEDPLAPLRELAAAVPGAAIVVVAEAAEPELGLAAVQAGAQDHLLKRELHPALLARAVRYAVERKRAEARLTRQALLDPLTGLPNRVLFGDRLSGALDRSRRTGLAPAVLFLDVDDFKEINDSLGHHAGDELLRALALSFGELLRPMDTVARFGGDEFLFLFEGLSGREEAMAIAERIGEAAASPVALGAPDGPTIPQVSIGIAMLEDPGVDLGDALREADAAMYRAKDLGGGRAEMYSEQDARRRVAFLPRGPEQVLRAAIGSDQLRVHYQPRVSIHGRTGLVGFEALVRWDHPERGLITPAEFVPLAEQSGLILELGDWVIEQALAQTRHWREARPGMAIAVNLSASQLLDPAFATRLGSALGRAGADPSTLWLEVVEDTVRDAQAVEALAALRALGVRLALDDFGRGHISAQRLGELPIDMLKIHGSLVATLGSGPDDGAVTAAVELGHALGLSVIAEEIGRASCRERV